jgi:hypothetical protein
LTVATGVFVPSLSAAAASTGVVSEPCRRKSVHSDDVCRDFLRTLPPQVRWLSPGLYLLPVACARGRCARGISACRSASHCGACAWRCLGDRRREALSLE